MVLIIAIAIDHLTVEVCSDTVHLISELQVRETHQHAIDDCLHADNRLDYARVLIVDCRRQLSCVLCTSCCLGWNKQLFTTSSILLAISCSNCDHNSSWRLLFCCASSSAECSVRLATPKLKTMTHCQKLIDAKNDRPRPGARRCRFLARVSPAGFWRPMESW